MKIIVEKLTDKSLADKACSFTVDKEISIKNMVKLYKSEHSPVRTQMYWIELWDIPSFVSTHFVRHKIGIEHFVKSNREDRNGGNTNVNRNTPVNHAMLANAQSIINMARKRLCYKSSSETQKVMQKIKNQILLVDPELFQVLYPDCVYRKSCYEFQSCGYYEKYVASQSC